MNYFPIQNSFEVIKYVRKIPRDRVVTPIYLIGLYYFSRSSQSKHSREHTVACQNVAGASAEGFMAAPHLSSISRVLRLRIHASFKTKAHAFDSVNRPILSNLHQVRRERSIES